ncbi:type II toxin-antitoxin system HicB family antitoxin [Desulfovibrio aminophilus]|uniref:type II toxin-antitoxin system HicB family antitoxin n=1 Tax=Desulfovibrio aminophilus TaxID=81425 RepID=UPI0004801B48|nr:toxin-antitoxin system HicB family antitoxin [Desulfovibrio aminophilus]
MNVQHYSYRVIWSEEDQEFVGLCAEFPSLSWLDESQLAALEGIVHLVGEVITDMAKNNEQPPAPISQRKFSGHISLRTTPDVHRDLALSAAERGVSINRYINSLVTSRGASA